MQLNDLKTSLFGFNKNDVCEYISQLNTVYEEKEHKIRQEHSETTEVLNRKNEELNNTAAALEQKNTDLIRENDTLRKKSELFEGEIKELKFEIKKTRETLASVLESADKQLDLFERKIENLAAEKSDENDYEK